MKHNKLKSVKQNMVETLELPKDLMYGDSLEYTGEYIKIQTKNAKLTVYGKKLSIEYYTNEDMKVVGFVKSIEYEA